MKKSKRILALLSTLLMLASCFALPYGVVAEETAQTAAELQAELYPNADASEPYYVVGRFQAAGEKITTKSEIQATGNDAQPWTCTGGDKTIIAPEPIDISGWDTAALAVVVDVTVSRQDGKTGVGALNSTGNQRVLVSNGSTAVLQINGIESPYLTHFTTNYANRAGDTITYVIPWEYMNGTTAIKKTEDTTVDRFFWAVYNDTYKVDTNDDEDTDAYNNPVGLDVTIENARIVDLSRDGQGYLTGTKALYHTDVVQIGDSSWGNLWTLYNVNNPLYSDITDLSKGNYELRFDAKVNPYGYFVAKPCDAEGNVVTPDSSTTNYGISQFKTAFYVNYTDVPEEDIPYLQYGSASGFNPGWVKLNGVQTNTSPAVYSDWTSVSYDISDSFSGITDTLTSLLVQRYNNNYISVDGKVVRFTGNDLTAITSVGGSDGSRYALPMMSSVRDIRIVDTDLEALNKAVQAVRNSLYDDTYAAAVEQAKAVLLDTDPTAEEIAAAVAALENGTATDHSTKVVGYIPGWTTNSPKTEGDNYSYDWGVSTLAPVDSSTYLDLSDGQTYDTTINLAGAASGADGATTALETRGVIGDNRYAVLTFTLAEAAPKLTKVKLRLRSKSVNRDNAGTSNGTPYIGTDERRTNTDYYMTEVSHQENEDGSVTYVMECKIDTTGDDWTGKDGNGETYDRRLDWSNVWQAQGRFYYANGSGVDGAMTVQEIRFEDRTVQVLTGKLAELSTVKGDFVPGEEWTAFETEQTAAATLLEDYLAGDQSVGLQDVQNEVATLEDLQSKLVNLEEEVVTFSQHAENDLAGPMNYNNGSGTTDNFYFDWKTGDGLTGSNTSQWDGAVGKDLTYGTGASVTADKVLDNATMYPGWEYDKVVDNLYFQATVTITKGEAWNDDYDFATNAMKHFEFRLQGGRAWRTTKDKGNQLEEIRTGSIRSDADDILSKVVSENGNKVTYTIECAMDPGNFDDEDYHIMNWTDVRASIIFVYLPFSVVRSEGAVSPASCELSDVKIVNKTKVLLKEELTKAANETGVYAENEALKTYKAAQDAAKVLLANENAYYTDLQKALDAINAAKESLKIVGHTVVTWKNWSRTILNGCHPGNTNFDMAINQFYNEWSGTELGTVDLSQYDTDKLYLRMNVNLGFAPGVEEDGTLATPLEDTVNLFRLALKSKDYKEGYTPGTNDEASCSWNNSQLAELNQTVQWGDNSLNIPLSSMLDRNEKLDIKSLRDILLITYADQIPKPENYDSMSADEQKTYKGKYALTFDNARIVDVTAEENLGTVETVGNGAVEITGDYVYGGDDTLTAKAGATSTFVGWKWNDKFVPATGGDDTLTLPVTGSQDITAYFVEDDEVAVVFYGKYNRVVDVQIVKKDAETVSFPPLPVIDGYTSTWAETEANLLTAIATNESGRVTVMSNHVADGTTGYTVKLSGTTNDAQTEGKIYDFDTRITVTADVPAGQVFSHWTIEGNVASYEPTLTFYVSGDMTVAAVLVTEGETVQQSVSAAINQATMTADGGTKDGVATYTFSIIAQSYVPADVELMEYGVIFAPDKASLETMDAAKTLKVVSSSRIPNRQYKIDLLQVKKDKTRCAMAYVTVRTADGIRTVYSSIDNIASMTAGA